MVTQTSYDFIIAKGNFLHVTLRRVMYESVEHAAHPSHFHLRGQFQEVDTFLITQHRHLSLRGELAERVHHDFKSVSLQLEPR